jgi:hypothetical protein
MPRPYRTAAAGGAFLGYGQDGSGGCIPGRMPGAELYSATARTHVHRAVAKLDVRDRAQLVVLAY